MPCPMTNPSLLASGGVAWLLSSAVTTLLKQDVGAGTSNEIVQSFFAKGVLLVTLAFFVAVAAAEYHGNGCCNDLRSFLFTSAVLPLNLVSLLMLALSPAVIPTRSAFSSLDDFAFQYRTALCIVAVGVEAISVFHRRVFTTAEHVVFLSLVVVVIGLAAFLSTANGEVADFSFVVARLLVICVVAWGLSRALLDWMWVGVCDFSSISPIKSPDRRPRTPPTSPIPSSPPRRTRVMSPQHTADQVEPTPHKPDFDSDPDVSFKNPEAVREFTKKMTPTPVRRSTKRTSTKQEQEDQKLASDIQFSDVPKSLRILSAGPKAPGLGGSITRLRSRTATATTPNW